MSCDIRIDGHLGQDWSDWFDSLLMEQMPEGTTRLSGVLPDQTSLFGLFSTLQRIGARIIDIQCTIA